MDWLRYHVATLDNPKIQQLSASLFKFWVNCLCLARIYEGILPEVSVISFRCRVPERQASEWMNELIGRKLVDESLDKSQHRQLVMHDWDEYQYVSDNVTERVRKHRAKRKGNVSVTPPDADSEQTRTEQTQTQTAGLFPANGNGHTVREFSDVVESLYARHPKKRDLVLVPEALQRAIERGVPLSQIEQAHEAWCRTEDWKKNNGRFCPKLAQWIDDRGYEAVPETDKGGRPPEHAII